MSYQSIFKNFCGALLLATFCSCGDDGSGPQTETSSNPVKWPRPDSTAYSAVIDGKQVKLFTLTNGKGTEAAITNYGGRLVGLWVPDKWGNLRNVVLGFDSVQHYTKSSEPYFGALIGRFGNRIAKGRFILNGKTYNLATNNGLNHLHGGTKGFQYVVWDAVQPTPGSLVLNYLSPDGEEGYPGNLQVKVTYSLTEDNTLHVDYLATSDATTIVNLTNHAFFNMNGAGAGSINNHILQVFADNFTPVDSTLIPLGMLRQVAGTPFDFRVPATIGSKLNENEEQIKNGLGFDHNFVLNRTKDSILQKAAVITGDQSGITMEIWTEEPGLQFYGGNFMQGKNKMLGNFSDSFRTAFCLEPQHFPDAPNRPEFPSVVLNPGKVYQTRSLYRFTVLKNKEE